MKKKIIMAAFAMIATLATAQNPYLPLWEHLPDGEPRVFEDPDNPGKMRAYIIGSHDLPTPPTADPTSACGRHR